MKRLTPRRESLEGELLPAEGSRALVGPIPTPDVVRNKLPEAKPLEPITEHEIRRPARTPSLEADVAVPALQAILTALASAICAGVLALALHWPARWVAVSFGISFAIAWLWRMRVADALLWQVERMIGRDVNHDGAVGEPGSPVLVNPLQARQEATQDLAADQAQAQREDLSAFLHRCYISGTSEAAHHITASGAERDEYVAHRDVLLALGIAQWRNPAKPKAGWRIVVSHQRAMELLAKHTL